jgi:hypothetical protein
MGVKRLGLGSAGSRRLSGREAASDFETPDRFWRVYRLFGAHWARSFRIFSPNARKNRSGAACSFSFSTARVIPKDRYRLTMPRLQRRELLEVNVLSLRSRVSQPLVKWMRLCTHDVAAYNHLPQSTGLRPALDRTNKKPPYAFAPRSLIDDQAHNLDLWRGNEKIAFFRGDPAEEMPFAFTGGGHSNEMVWAAEKQLDPGRDFLRLGGITELTRKSCDLACIVRGGRPDERAPLGSSRHMKGRRNRQAAADS